MLNILLKNTPKNYKTILVALLSCAFAKLFEFANGTTAMKEMAQRNEPNLIGFTQATEINYADGVVLATNLPNLLH